MPVETMSLRQLNRATLQRQLLLERAPVDVVDAVRQVVALQAQEPASPYVALWNRVADFDADELDRAFAERRIVKCSLMRITLHAIACDDHGAFHGAMTPILRAARLNDRRFRDTGMAIADADALVDSLVEFAAEPRSKDEVAEHLLACDARTEDPMVWWALRTYAPLIHSPVGSPWAFGRQPSFERAPAASQPNEEEAQRALLRRYLRAFGPATPHDFAQFTMHKVSRARELLAEMADELVTYEGPGGAVHHDLVDGPPLVAEDTAAPPLLMAMWDSTLLAYADRSRIIPEPYRSLVIRRNGDTLPTVLVDGFVAGVWRCVDGGVEVTPFEPFDADTWDRLAHEAALLSRLVAERDPLVYDRFRRWWKQLPTEDRRVLPY